MGKKINPIIYRMNTTAEHNSKWFADKQTFPMYLQQDVQIRKYLKQQLKDSGVAKIEIRRSAGKITIAINTSKPGVVIGRSGASIDALKKGLKKKFFGSEKVVIEIEVEEVRTPDLSSELVLQSIAYQVEKRVPFRRAMKRAIESVMAAGAKGVKVILSGRLNGVEIARTEMLVEGSIPTHTLRADIDYSRGHAETIYGKIGIKVWIYKGLKFGDEDTVVKPVSRQRRNTGRRGPAKGKKRTVKSSTRSEKRTIVKAKKEAAPAKDAGKEKTNNSKTA